MLNGKTKWFTCFYSSYWPIYIYGTSPTEIRLKSYDLNRLYYVDMQTDAQIIMGIKEIVGIGIGLGLGLGGLQIIIWLVQRGIWTLRLNQTVEKKLVRETI